MTFISKISATTNEPQDRLTLYRARVAAIRERALKLFHGGATGIQVAANISESTDAFLVELLEERFAALDAGLQQAIQENSAMIAVGGSGRGELAPYSDADILFLYRSTAGQSYAEFVAQIVRDCWDAGIKLGHSVRTIGESVSMSKQDAQVATAVVEARLLWGSRELFENFEKSVARRVVRGRRHAFVAECVKAREQERTEHGLTVTQLEPDIKRSLGGLRDIHLMRWVGFAHYGVTAIDSLRLQGAISRDDARKLIAAQEFLMRLRIDLHFQADKAHDVLTRDEQLRIAEERKFESTAGQRRVERFMQTYFRHSTTIAEITRRFVARLESKSITSRMLKSLVTHRANRIMKVGPDSIDVIRAHRPAVLSKLEQILKVYHSAALYGVSLTLDLTDAIKESLPTVGDTLSDTSARLFRDILATSGHLGPILRSMYETGLLELLVPDMAHARCLLQFNQYHSYTVDEHSLRAVEAAENFDQDDGPVGAAYRRIRQKELLHLALLLHDLGKGFEEDHSDVGCRIAVRMGARLQFKDHDRDTLAFLVQNHLKMLHLALRRDISDPDVLIEFSREVGSPETLRLLYVLTAADLTAVGPGVWTDWKSELLSELYDRVMLILSGRHYQFHEEERLKRVKDHVRESIVPLESIGDEKKLQEWIRKWLDTFPPHYLSTTPPDRIAADLDLIGQLQPGVVEIVGKYDEESGTVDYRIIAHENDIKGCFHRTCGALSAKRLEILSAQISTSLEGVVVDGFRVLDSDYTDEVPPERIQEVADSVRSALMGQTAVPELFQRYKRFDSSLEQQPVSNLPTRVVIDNRSSDRCTIIDVFAHDRPALLYTIARAIHQLELSVVLAKIATHLDQVVDVFYVTDCDGQKIVDSERLQAIRESLTRTITEFEDSE